MLTLVMQLKPLFSLYHWGIDTEAAQGKPEIKRQSLDERWKCKKLINHEAFAQMPCHPAVLEFRLQLLCFYTNPVTFTFCLSMTCLRRGHFTAGKHCSWNLELHPWLRQPWINHALLSWWRSRHLLLIDTQGLMLFLLSQCPSIDCRL